MEEYVNKLKMIGKFDVSKKPASVELVNQVEETIGMVFGDQVRNYLTKCGRISFSFVELYGVTENKQLKSDLVIKTQFLHSTYPQTQGYVALEDKGDGDYIICNKFDHVFGFTPTISDEVRVLNMNFEEYIVFRYKEVSEL